MVTLRLVRRTNKDNVMVRYQESSEWSLEYQTDGSQGWSNHGIYLVDFGRAIDLRAFNDEQKFKMNCQETDAAIDCPEVIKGESWRFEPDYYGVASVAYTLLFGAYMEVETGSITRLIKPLKRYWNPCWAILFSKLLNGSMEDVIQLLEEQIVMECESKGKSLRGFLRTIESSRFE
jgi:checkpoint serine/threonine-protein kinase